MCFAGFADDCHYRGDIYHGPRPTEHILDDPTFDCGVDESEDLGQRTAMLFVKLSGGRCQSHGRPLDASYLTVAT